MILFFTFIITFFGFIEDPVLKDIYDQAIKKGIPETFLKRAFEEQKIVVHKKIPGFFARPYEKKSWDQYKKIFVTKKRIDGGLDFYKKKRDKLSSLTVRDGINVDPFIVLSIIGIESNYGLNKGKYTVFGALYTQVLLMPKRSKWAKRQLVDFLLLCYQDNLSPHSIQGSYAGAFGYGQFIPSSFISYSVDGNSDGKRKPYDWDDVIASITNYLIKNGYPSEGDDDKSIYKSVFAYNHADNYVKAVLALSQEIKKNIN